MSDKPFQTRSDSFGGNYPGTEYFHTLSEAVCAYKEDNSIWKISWRDPVSKISYRIRPKYSSKDDEWAQLSESKLKKLCPAYSNASPHELFWVDQSLDILLDLITKEKRDTDTELVTNQSFDVLLTPIQQDDTEVYQKMTEEEQNAAILRAMWSTDDLLKVFTDDGVKIVSN